MRVYTQAHATRQQDFDQPFSACGNDGEAGADDCTGVGSGDGEATSSTGANRGGAWLTTEPGKLKSCWRQV